MRAADPTFSIVIPCFNEADSLELIIDEILSFLNETEFREKYELIIVDDGSSDKSWQVIEKIADRTSCVTGIHRAKNGGMWRAIQSGFHHVSGTYVTYLPADGEITAAETYKLMKLAQGADMVVSERVSSDDNIRRIVRPWYREVLSWGQRTLTRVLLGCDISRAEGVFLFKWHSFERFALAPRDDNVLFLELLARGLSGTYTVDQTTMHYTIRRSGRSKTLTLPHILGTFWDLIRLRFRILRTPT